MGAPDSLELLVLDVNGVLYTYDRQRRIDTLARLLDREPDAIEAAIFDSGLEDAADAGELGPEEYLAAVGRALHVRFDRHAWRTALTEAVAPNDEVLTLLGRIVTPVEMVTLSNNGLLVMHEAERVFPRILDLGIEFHVAAELGASKPDRHVYLDLCERCGVPPARAAFVDDKVANVDGARRAGLDAHLFVGAEGLHRFLTDRGVVFETSR